MKIHYNVTGADRKALVKVIADTAGARAVYKGMPSAAYEIDYYTVTKDGTLEFSDRSDSEEVEAVLEALAAAGFDGVGETEKQTEGTNETPEMPTAADTEPQESEEQEPVQLTVSPISSGAYGCTRASSSWWRTSIPPATILPPGGSPS